MPSSFRGSAPGHPFRRLIPAQASSKPRPGLVEARHQNWSKPSHVLGAIGRSAPSHFCFGGRSGDRRGAARMPATGSPGKSLQRRRSRLGFGRTLVPASFVEEAELGALILDRCSRSELTPKIVPNGCPVSSSAGEPSCCSTKRRPSPHLRAKPSREFSTHFQTREDIASSEKTMGRLPPKALRPNGREILATRGAESRRVCARRERVRQSSAARKNTIADLVRRRHMMMEEYEAAECTPLGLLSAQCRPHTAHAQNQATTGERRNGDSLGEVGEFGCVTHLSTWVPRGCVG